MLLLNVKYFHLNANISIYTTQIILLEYGTTEISLVTTKTIPKFVWNQTGKHVMRLCFRLYHTNRPFGKRVNKNCMGYNQKIPKFVWDYTGKHVMMSCFHLYHPNHPFGKRGPQNLCGLQVSNL